MKREPEPALEQHIQITEQGKRRLGCGANGKRFAGMRIELSIRRNLRHEVISIYNTNEIAI